MTFSLSWNQTRFFTSVNHLAQCPTPAREVVLLGRSNAGKSSTLNALCGQRQLARVSRTPGRTQMLNYFTLMATKESANAEPGYLVDAPGFGYAQADRRQRQQWQTLVDDYLATREALMGMVLISDIRHAPSGFDLQYLHWAQRAPLPSLWLLNKADKLRQHARQQSCQKLQHQFPQQRILPFSALRLYQLETVREAIAQLFQSSE